MTRARKLSLLLPAVAALLVSGPAEAAPLPSSNGSFGIAPARRYIVSTPGISLQPTTVTNTTGTTYQVSVFPALLSQNLTGAFDFSSAPRDLSAAKLVISASPVAFGLSPGQEQQVALQWNLLPAGKKWVGAGVIFQGIPQGQNTPLHVITRLLSVNFLRLPGPVTVNGVFTGLFPEQFAPRVLRFVARVKNLGNDFTAPSDGHLIIRDASGHVALDKPWKGIQMLPGATVDFPIDVRQILQAGNYTATATMRFGGQRSKTVPFRLVGPNQLPTPAITIQSFNASGTIGSPAQVTARVISRGTAAASVTLHLYLGTQNATPGQSALATDTVVYSNLAPGSVTRLSRPLGGGLKKGSYRAIVTWKDPTGAPHQLEAEFTATVSKSWLEKLWDWIKHHLVLFIGLLVLALLILLAYLYNKARQRQRQMEAELAAARAAVEARQPVAAGAIAEAEPEPEPDEPYQAAEPEPDSNPGPEWEPRSNPGSEWEPREPDPPTSPGPAADPEPPSNPDPGGNPDRPPATHADPVPQAGATGDLAPAPPPEAAAQLAPTSQLLRAPPPAPANEAAGPPPGPGPATGAPSPTSARKRGLTAAALLTVGVAGAVAVIRWRNRR